MGDSRAGSVLWHLHHWLGSAATPADDGRLLERFVHQRDEEAFAELVSRHGPLVFGLCRRLLGHVQDAEDVFQATFLVLARKATTIRKPESLSCWLHGVAYRLALKAKAEANKRRIHERKAVLPAGSAEADLSWREVRGLLDEELQRLPEKQRLPLVLCYLEGLTQDEASRRLGWPRGTLKRRLESGRERLLDALAITHDGKMLACGGRGMENKTYVYLWDVETGKLLSQHELEKTNQILRLLFTPDDKTLIVGDFGNIIRLWDVASKKITHELKGHAGMPCR